MTTRIPMLASLVLATLTTTSHAQTPVGQPGRLLASNCFQCHGTDGRGGFDAIAGKSSSEIVKELKEMRAENKPGEIMNRHAAGYTDAQLKLIGDYFATRK